MPRINTLTRINSTQATILALMYQQRSGMTRSEMEALLAFPVTTSNLGPMYRESKEAYPDSLYSMGYVTAEYDDNGEGGRMLVKWSLTDEGREVARNVRGRDSLVKGQKIPSSLLDAVVKAFRETRTYGLELYTNDDIVEIRSKLGEEYHTTPIDAIRQMIVNRRKQGAFRKDEDELPLWYRTYRAGQHWQAVESEAIENAGGSCAMNADHRCNLIVAHRRFTDSNGGAGCSVLHNEDSTDTVVLCRECLKRSRKSLPAVPPEMP